MNDPELVPVPAGVVTATGPVVAPVGTVAVMLESETTLNVAAVPLKPTAVAPVKALPVIVTVVPAGPEEGESDETVGRGAVTVNDPELVPVPAGVVTATGPVVAPLGTVAVMLESETTLNVAAFPLKLTPVAPVKALPVIVTEVPTGPEDGETDDTAGGGGALRTWRTVCTTVPAGAPPGWPEFRSQSRNALSVSRSVGAQLVEQ
jgi:hypothetical protein